MKTTLVLACCIIAIRLFSQGIGINANGANPNPKAMLDIDVSAITGMKRGLLIPRMSLVERNAILTPVPEGLLIYNLTNHCFDYYNGVAWLDCFGLWYQPLPCPSGFVAVNSKYCIETNQRQSLQIFIANDSCMSKNSHLCSWAEWHYACIKSGILSLQNMVDDWEWVDDGSSENNFMVVGDNGNCEATYIQHVLNTHTSRCCFRR